MLLTPQEVRNAQISTRFFSPGYDIEETDQLLDNCEHTINALGGALIAMKRLLEAHNIPIPQSV